MKVYGSKASPFVQRVLMAARLKGHELPIEPPPGGDMKSPQFRAISPLGRIPVLDHDGWTLAESGPIVGYLDDVLDGDRLYPADPRAKAEVGLIESLAICEVGAVRAVMIGRVFGMPIAPEVVDAGRQQVAVGLDAIDTARGKEHAFAMGPNPTAADCVLVPLLSLLDIIDPSAGTRALLDERPTLADYQSRMENHPVIGRSVSEMRESFAALLARRKAAT